MNTRLRTYGIFGGIVSLVLLIAQHTFGQTNLQFTAISATDEQAIHLAWSSIPHEIYEIDEADSLSTNPITWNVLYNDYPSQGSNTFWLDTGNYLDVPPILHPKYMPMRFYRIKDTGVDTTSDEPSVAIVSPTNGIAATGELTITVAAVTDQAGGMSTKLYVDGQEMQMPGATTNYLDSTGVTNYETDTYTINTCEWGNEMCGQIFRYAIATGRAERNPVPDLRGALKTPVAKHHPHLKAVELPDFLKKLEVYHGNSITKLALRFLLLTFVRTTELRAAEWPEIDWDNAEWRIPAERMKMRDPHIVPLSNQAVAVLRELQKHTGNRQHLFPNQHNMLACMSANTMIYALYRMGYHSRATGHGFRATASTILNENGFVPDVIERQLAHGERNKVRAAYNHAQYLPERRKMMQWWADYLAEVAKKKPNQKNLVAVSMFDA